MRFMNINIQPTDNKHYVVLAESQTGQQKLLVGNKDQVIGFVDALLDATITPYELSKKVITHYESPKPPEDATQDSKNIIEEEL